MKTITRHIIALCMAIGLTGIAQAYSLVQTESTGSFLPGYDSSFNLSFNDFDTGGGVRTLTSVTIDVSFTTSGGSFSAQNRSPRAESAQLMEDVTANVSGSALGFTMVNQLETVTGQTLQMGPGGSAGDSASTVTPGTSTDSGVITLSNPTTVQGTGTFCLSYESTKWDYLRYGGGNMSLQVNGAYEQGTIAITYNYTGTAIANGAPAPVPEPASVGLLVVGGLALALRRRFMKKA